MKTKTTCDIEENPNAHLIEIFNLVQQDFIKQKTNEVMETLGKPVMTFNFTHVNSYPICQINWYQNILGFFSFFGGGPLYAWFEKGFVHSIS